MNFHILLSNRPVLEALRAAVRICAVVLLVAGSYCAYRVYAEHRSAQASLVLAGEAVKTRLQMLEQLRSARMKAASVSPAQLQVDAPAQFATLLENLCLRLGIKLESLEADTSPRAAVDLLAGGTGIEGWVVYGHRVQLLGKYEAVRRLLDALRRFPMPLEITALEISRIGFANASSPLIQLKLTVDVCHPGSASTTSGSEAHPR